MNMNIPGSDRGEMLDDTSDTVMLHDARYLIARCIERSVFDGHFEGTRVQIAAIKVRQHLIHEEDDPTIIDDDNFIRLLHVDYSELRKASIEDKIVAPFFDM